MAASPPQRRGSTPAVQIAQKRALEDDHAPAVSSPLNPDFASTAKRATREKKESLKKRESKGPSTNNDRRGTPDRAMGSTKRSKTDSPSDDLLQPVRYILPLPRASDYEDLKGPVLIPHHEQNSTQFYEVTDHIYNRKGFRYSQCVADPAFPSSFYYRQSETYPYYSRFSFQDSCSVISFDQSGKQVTFDKGFRMARANVGVRQGRWYWECKITKGVRRKPRSSSICQPSSTSGDVDVGGHVRMGWARREAPLDAPVGFDAYSYGLRDLSGQKVHMSRPKDFFPTGESIEEGDVIGFEINLPSEALHRRVVEGNFNPAADVNDEQIEPTASHANIVRDRVPIRYKGQLYFEHFEYHPTKELEDLMNPSPTATSSASGSAQRPGPTHPLVPLRTLPHSNIKVYKNGKLMGTPFTDLLCFLPPASEPAPQPGSRKGLDDGMVGYFPAVSVFQGGAAEINFGPDFWFPIEAEEEDEDVDMIGLEDNTETSKKVASSNKLRPICERYNEQIAEDVLYDLVDEVDWWLTDGGGKEKKVDIAGSVVSALGPVDAQISGVEALAGDLGGISGEIKEIVQEDE